MDDAVPTRGRRGRNTLLDLLETRLDVLVLLVDYLGERLDLLGEIVLMRHGSETRVFENSHNGLK